MKELLPIGSVVKLNDSKLIMIIGYSSISYNNTFELYDYVGCVYPAGISTLDNVCSFNRDDIQEIIYEGYSDSDFDVFKNKLENVTEFWKEDKFGESKVNDDRVISSFTSKLLDSNVVGGSYEVRSNIQDNVVLKDFDSIISLLDSIKFLDNEEMLSNKELVDKIPKTLGINDLVDAVRYKDKIIEDDNKVITVGKGDEKLEFSPVDIDEFVLPHYKFEDDGIVIN